MFLEPTCPFSARAFGKLDETLALAGEDRITIKIRLQSQPWHMYSGVIVRCILAGSTLPAGKEAAKAVLAAVAAPIAVCSWPTPLPFRTLIGRSNGIVNTHARTESTHRRPS
jgi:hypothetical protein